MDSKKGYLVLIGGAEDRKDAKIVLRNVVGINNAKNVVVIPSASSYPLGLAEDYYHAFREIGVQNINIFDIRTREEADRPEYLDKIEQSDLIFFTGGDQVKLVQIFHNTKLLEKIKNQHYKGATIAGTSAGAAAASNPLLYDGDDRGLQKGSIHISEGFGFIEDITIDTHFMNRGRIGRLTQFLCTGNSSRGIGLGEDTGIIITPDNHFEVIGSGMVTVVNTNNVTFSNYEDINENDPIAINDIKVGFLQAGCIFDIDEWQIISCKNNHNKYKKEEIKTELV